MLSPRFVRFNIVLQSPDTIRVFNSLRSPLNTTFKNTSEKKRLNKRQLVFKRGINKTHKMISKICMVLLVQLVVAAFAADKKCDNVECASIPKHYEEMGCEAVKSEGECCASR